MVVSALLLINAWFTLVVMHRRSIVLFYDRQSILHTNDHRQWQSPILMTSVNQTLCLVHTGRNREPGLTMWIKSDKNSMEILVSRWGELKGSPQPIRLLHCHRYKVINDLYRDLSLS